jgi:hypothetical protein
VLGQPLKLPALLSRITPDREARVAARVRALCDLIAFKKLSSYLPAYGACDFICSTRESADCGHGYAPRRLVSFMLGR